MSIDVDILSIELVSILDGVQMYVPIATEKNMNELLNGFFSAPLEQH